jgi:hypothetical protein
MWSACNAEIEVEIESISSPRCNYDCVLPQLIPMNAMDIDIDDEDVLAPPWVPRLLQLEIWCLRASTRN